MKKSLYLLIPIIVFLIWGSQIDDDLSEEAIHLIERIDIHSKSEAYLFFLGISSKEGESPIEVGNNLLVEDQKLSDDINYEFVDYPQSEKLVLPQGDEFCSSWEDTCLKYLFSSEINIEDLTRKHHVLISRSNRFFEFSEYTTLSMPAISERFPPYEYLVQAVRIKILEAISMHRNGNSSNAIDLLLLQISQLRKSLALQDNLIGKLVLLMKLTEIIDVYSIILVESKLDAEIIPSLSQSEKSFYQIAAREFAYSYYTFKNIEKYPEIFEREDKLPNWISRILFKPNMTLNAIMPSYYRLENLAQLSPSEFAKQIETEEDISPSWISILRNYSGVTLLASPPSYNQYVARFTDFDAKLALFNQFHNSKLKLNKMQNPYYGAETPTKTEDELCFKTPIEDKRFLGCLRIKIIH